MVSIRSAQTLVYRIDADDRISYLCPEWAEEAQKWPSARLAPDQVLGRSLWDCMQDGVGRGLYRAIVARARGGKAIQFACRCDTPDRRRLYFLEIKLAGTQEVEFSSTLESEEARPVVALLDPEHPRDNSRSLLMCSWCHRIALPVDYWVPLEEAVALGGFMEADPLPRLVPGVCPTCQQQLRRKIAE